MHRKFILSLVDFINFILEKVLSYTHVQITLFYRYVADFEQGFAYWGEGIMQFKIK